MSKPYWNENKQRWELCIYENRKRVHTFTSTKKGTAGKNECIRKRTEWVNYSVTSNRASCFNHYCVLKVYD